MDIKKIIDSYKNGEISVYNYTSELLNKIKEDRTNSFISINERALDRATKLDEKLKSGEEIGALFGVPVSLKDNIMTKDLKTT